MKTFFEHIDDNFLFGKFRGCTLAEVLTYNPSYLEWVAQNVDYYYCHMTKSVLDEIEMLFPCLTLSKCLVSMTIEPGEEYDPMYECDNNDPYSSYDEEPTYDRYNGSYAQDVMGYSDDDIDTIFDGEPDAYWNID